MSATILAETERLLGAYHPDQFDSSFDAWSACIEAVRQLEETQAWTPTYPSLEAFYRAHEHRHPDIRAYPEARRRLETTPLSNPLGPPSEQLARFRRSPWMPRP
jgi:hypothetical protein